MYSLPAAARARGDARRRFVRPIHGTVLVLALAACGTSPVAWSDPAPLSTPNGALPATLRLAVDTSGRAYLVADSAGAPATSPASTIGAPGLCAASVRAIQGTNELHAAWWSVRRDSSAGLYAAASSDSGRTWSAPSPVDTSDASSRGCNRPPPSVAIVGDDLHVAYSMAAPEGTGVFFAHFMGTMLHSPVAVIYGDRLVPTALAVDGDTVAVAYAAPNGSRPQVDVAISWTQGHIFEYHGTASRDVDVATAPAVALDGREIAVGWTAGGGADTARADTRIVRVGRMQ